MGTKNKYTSEFKMKLVEEYLNSSMSETAFAKEHEISRSTFHSWVKNYKEHGKDYFSDTSRRKKKTEENTSIKNTKSLEENNINTEEESNIKKKDLENGKSEDISLNLEKEDEETLNSILDEPPHSENHSKLILDIEKTPDESEKQSLDFNKSDMKLVGFNEFYPIEYSFLGVKTGYRIIARVKDRKIPGLEDYNNIKFDMMVDPKTEKLVNYTFFVPHQINVEMPEEIKEVMQEFIDDVLLEYKKEEKRRNPTMVKLPLVEAEKKKKKIDKELIKKICMGIFIYISMAIFLFCFKLTNSIFFTSLIPVLIYFLSDSSMKFIEEIIDDIHENGFSFEKIKQEIKELEKIDRKMEEDKINIKDEIKKIRKNIEEDIEETKEELKEIPEMIENVKEDMKEYKKKISAYCNKLNDKMKKKKENSKPSNENSEKKKDN